MLTEPGARLRCDRRRYSADETRVFRLRNGLPRLVTLPTWRWKLLERRAEDESGSVECLLGHLWNLAAIPAEINPTSPTACELFRGEIEDAVDEWHESQVTEKRMGRRVHRRRPANWNCRPRAAERVEKEKREAERQRRDAALYVEPLPQVDVQPLPPAVAAAFARLFQKT